MTETETLVRRFLDALGRQAVDEMVACLAGEVVYDPPAGERLVGREAVKTALIGDAARHRRSLSDLVVMTDGGSRAAAEYTLKDADGAVAAGSFLEVEDGEITRLTTFHRR